MVVLDISEMHMAFQLKMSSLYTGGVNNSLELRYSTKANCEVSQV